MGWFWILLVIAWTIIWVATVVNIIQRRHERSKAATFAWIIIVLVFSIVGTIIYILVNGVSSGGPAVGATDPDRAPGQKGVS